MKIFMESEIKGEVLKRRKNMLRLKYKATINQLKDSTVNRLYRISAKLNL